jgi:hypothetical protein
MDVSVLVIIFWPIIALLEVLCWKAHFQDTESICPAKQLIFLSDSVL